MTDATWHRRPMRIAALQCNFEVDPFAVPDRWHEAGFNVEQLLHVMGDGYYAVFDEARHGEDLRRYLEKTRALGIRVIAYANTHMLSMTMQDRFESWAARKPDGSMVMGYETFPIACQNSPWHDWLCDNLRALAAYDIDGVFSDGPLGACACGHCQRRFQDDFGYPLPASPARGTREAADLRTFDINTRLRSLRRMRDAVKGVKPELVFYSNLNVWGLPHEKFLDVNDIVGSEGGFLFYNAPAGNYLWKTSWCAKVLEACAQGKPTVVFAAGDQKPWSCFLHTASETTLMYAASIANNASVWYGLHCPVENLKLPGGRAAAAMNRFHAEHADVYDGTRSLARTYVLHAESTRLNYSTSHGESDFYTSAGAQNAAGVGDARKSVEGFAAMLYRNQAPFDAVTERSLSAGELEARGRCLVLPTAACLSDAAVEGVRAFVRDGGLLVASLDTSWFDEHGARRNQPALADVFGVTFDEGMTRFSNFDYFEVTAPAHAMMRGIEPRLLRAPNFGLRIAPTTAEVLGVFHEPLAGRYVPMSPLATPAVVCNAYGDGFCLYFAGDFGEFYWSYNPAEYARILANAIHDVAPPVVTVENAPASLEVVVRTNAAGNRVFVHCLNYTGGMTRPVDNAVPLHDVLLRFDPGRLGFAPTSVRALWSREQPVMRKEGASAVVEAPPLREYEVFVVE